MTLIVIKYQINIWNGNIKYPTKPLYTYGCNETLPQSNQTMSKIENPADEVFWLYRISIHYYVVLGTVLSLIIGLPLSWFTDTKETRLFDPDTMSPFMHRFLSESALSSREKSVQKELQTLTRNDDKETKRYANGDKPLDK